MGTVREMDFVDECYADKDLSLLKKLTLVIPTYNRNYYLSRCLWYHAHFPFGQIIVADSSPEEKKVVNRETVAKVREMFGADILYLEYKPETDKYGGDIYRKWGDAVMHVDTVYTQICTDKEFVIPISIKRLIKHLDSHSDFTTAQGDEYGISMNATASHKTSYHVFNRNPGRQMIEDVEALDRISHAIGENGGFSQSLLLSLSKSANLKDIYAAYYANENPHDLRYAEVYFAYAGYIAGRHYCKNELISRVRDEIGKYIDINNADGKFFCKSSESSTTRYPTYEDYLAQGTVEKYYAPIYKAFVEIFQKYTTLSHAEIESFMNSKEILLKTVFTQKKPTPLSNPVTQKLFHLCRSIKPIRNSYRIIRRHLGKSSGREMCIDTEYEKYLTVITHIIKTTWDKHKSDRPII